jgi:hypothetical protein
MATRVPPKEIYLPLSPHLRSKTSAVPPSMGRRPRTLVARPVFQCYVTCAEMVCWITRSPPDA